MRIAQYITRYMVRMAHLARLSAAVITASFVIGLMAVAPASAAGPYSPFGNLPCSKASDAAACNTSGQDPLTGTNGVLHNATNLIAVIAGAAAVIIIVLSGIRYIISNGEAEQVSRAKKSLIYASIGLVVIILGQAIISFVLNRV